MKQAVIVGGALGAAYLLTKSRSSSSSAKDGAGGFAGASASIEGKATVGGGASGWLSKAWDLLSPGGLDGVETAADVVGDKVKDKAESIAWKLAIAGGVVIAGFVVYRKVMAP